MMRINKIKVYLFSFASLFLSACETVPQVVVESQSFHTNREIYFIGGGKCLQPKVYSSASVQPLFPRYDTVDCNHTKGAKYVIEKVAYLSCEYDGERHCNSGGEGKYYLQLQPNVRVVITPAQLRNGQLPDGFVDKQGLSEHNKKVEADKKAVEIAKDRAEQIQAKNAALQRKVIADFKKDSATQINNVCQNITSNSFDLYRCKDTLTHQMKREKSGQLPSCWDMSSLSAECQAIIYSTFSNQLILLGQETTEFKIKAGIALLYMAGAECNCSMNKAF